MSERITPEQVAEIRRASVKWHCENQQCTGCPDEFTCEVEEPDDYTESYDGEDYGYE